MGADWVEAVVATKIRQRRIRAELLSASCHSIVCPLVSSLLMATERPQHSHAANKWCKAACPAWPFVQLPFLRIAEGAPCNSRNAQAFSFDHAWIERVHAD